MGVTMAEIARRLNLSKSTVSRALSADPRVKEETRRRVLALAEELNYRPHPVASGLARRRTHTLGLVIPSPPRSFSNPFYLEFIGGVGDYAMKHGYTFFFVRSEELLTFGWRGAPAIAALADGYILTEPQVDDPRLRFLREEKRPFVFLGRPMEAEAGDDVSWVDGDNAGGAQAVVRHLIELGHRRIACIAGPPDQVATYHRLSGYKEALAEAGLPFEARAVAPGDFTEEGGRQAARALLELYPEMTALFASNDLMAMGAMQELRHAGKGVPDEISVAGFDGIRLGGLVTPRLTTVSQPIYRLGEVAARLLLAAIAGRPVPAGQVVLPCRLLVQESTVPPPPEDLPEDR